MTDAERIVALRELATDGETEAPLSYQETADRLEQLTDRDALRERFAKWVTTRLSPHMPRDSALAMADELVALALEGS